MPDCRCSQSRHKIEEINEMLQNAVLAFKNLNFIVEIQVFSVKNAVFNVKSHLKVEFSLFDFLLRKTYD
jgi:hypothetical protein